MPSEAGDALTMFPHTVPAFWICRPPIVRAAARSPSKTGGRSASATSVQVVSAGIRHASPSSRHAAQPRQGRDVEHGPVDRSRGVCRVDVRAAGEDQARRFREQPQGILEPVGAQVGRERAGDAGDADGHGQAATLGRTSFASRSRFAGSQLSGLSTRWSTPPRASILRADPVRDLLGLAQQVVALPVVEVHARVDAEQRRGVLGSLARLEHVHEVRVDARHLLGLPAVLDHVPAEVVPVAVDHLGRRRGVGDPRLRVLRDPAQDRLDRGHVLAVDLLGRLGAAADPDRGVRALGRLGVDGQVVDAVEAALVGDVVLRPQRGDQLEELVHPRAALAVGDAARPRTRPPSSPRPRPGSSARPTAGRASPTAWRTDGLAERAAPGRASRAGSCA